MILELCTDSYCGAQLASKYGLKRIELCSALNEGGLTPSFGLIKKCSEIQDLEVHVIIRPRSGNFNYSDKEIDTMKEDIRASKKAGAKGVVFGILTDSQSISKVNYELVELAKELDLECTFHRAFDVCNKPFKSIEKLISIGFDRLLTSGQENTAIEGLELISELQRIHGMDIQIMAGSGINSENSLVFEAENITSLHFTARYRTGNSSTLGFGQRFQPDEKKLKSIVELFN